MGTRSSPLLITAALVTVGVRLVTLVRKRRNDGLARTSSTSRIFDMPVTGRPK